MSSRIYNNDELMDEIANTWEFMSHQLSVLRGDPKLGPNLIATKIGLIVATSRLLFGLEVVDAAIIIAQNRADRIEAGFCIQCLKSPASINKKCKGCWDSWGG